VAKAIELDGVAMNKNLSRKPFVSLIVKPGIKVFPYWTIDGWMAQYHQSNQPVAAFLNDPHLLPKSPPNAIRSGSFADN
jgi:hypothetical protein